VPSRNGWASIWARNCCTAAGNPQGRLQAFKLEVLHLSFKPGCLNTELGGLRIESILSSSRPFYLGLDSHRMNRSVSKQKGTNTRNEHPKAAERPDDECSYQFRSIGWTIPPDLMGDPDDTCYNVERSATPPLPSKPVASDICEQKKYFCEAPSLISVLSNRDMTWIRDVISGYLKDAIKFDQRLSTTHSCGRWVM
jgi:hypothetical protein